MSPSNRKRLGEFLILLIYLIIEGYGLWDISWPIAHFWALFAGVAGFVALLFMDGGLTGSQISIYTVIAIAGCVMIYFVAPPANKTETTVSGSLEPADDPTPRTGCDPSDNPTDQGYWGVVGGFIHFPIARPKNPPPQNATIVALATDGIIVTKNEKVPVLEIPRCTLLSIENAPNGLLIDAKVYDTSGKLIASVADNNFTAVEGANSHVTREGDLSTLIIRDATFGERLWVHFANRHAVEVRGIFMCPREMANVIVVTKDIFRDYPTAAMIMNNVLVNACTVDAPMGYWAPVPPK
jgi:hypothetical protein